MTEIPILLKALNIFGGVVGTAGGATGAWVWYDRKRRDKILDEYGSDIVGLKQIVATHENKFITEDKVREIVSEVTKSLREDNEKMMEKLDKTATDGEISKAILQRVEDRLNR